MNRRSFLKCAAVLAPAVILTPGLLMKVKPLWTPPAYATGCQWAFSPAAFSTHVTQRLDLIGTPWQIYSHTPLQNTPGKEVAYEFVELSTSYAYPTAKQMELHKRMAELAFKRAIARAA